jgi:hypothetical protein
MSTHSNSLTNVNRKNSLGKKIRKLINKVIPLPLLDTPREGRSLLEMTINQLKRSIK